MPIPPDDLLPLLDIKAWELFGLTGEEFLARRATGVYEADFSPEVNAMEAFIRTGCWDPRLHVLPPREALPAGSQAQLYSRAEVSAEVR